MNKRDPYNFDSNKNPLANNLLKSYHTPELEKAEVEIENELEKGGKRAVIGEKREFSGRMYIKTTTGWKFFGKGTGTKAQEHHENHAAPKASETPTVKKEDASSTESDMESPETYKKMSDAELKGAIIALETIENTALKTDHEAAGKTLRAMSVAKAELDSREQSTAPKSETVAFDWKDINGGVDAFNEVLKKNGGDFWDDGDYVYISSKPITEEMKKEVEEEGFEAADKHDFGIITMEDEVEEIVDQYKDVFKGLGMTISTDKSFSGSDMHGFIVKPKSTRKRSGTAGRDNARL